MVGSATDLSGLSPAHLNALTQHEQTPRPRGRLGPVQAGPNPATKVKKTKTKKDVKPGQSTSKFAQARGDKKAAKEAKPASSPTPAAPTTSSMIIPVFEKTAAVSSSSSAAAAEAAVDNVDCSLGEKGRPTGPTAGVTKTQTDVQPGQGTSKYARARREKAAAKATTTSSPPPPPPRHADDLVGDRPGLHKDRCPHHLRRRRRSHSRARSQSHHGRLYLEVVWATFQVALGITGLSAASFLKTLYSTSKTPTVHRNVPV
ncbi:hypothetical protein NCS57_00276700 [Fusarium keratoplasticum]|uniref:Uncharacterized protein n=1 Tax=Fusarium keratoplasticum TaxID=1328300 RepID=A0ACC0RB94_9HYPO|nr:hypothetical protein NCS57_00276700 [Fusarium keratoplasticum]KAI8679973.1 hypothetical protein NCS57_00276700 [Fusarium keratoplasticum]